VRITPLVAVDGIVEIYDENIFQGIVLIERKNEPYGIALPGGFVEKGETVENALIREMGEELNLNVEIDRLLDVYSEPNRDPRYYVVSLVYLVKANTKPKAGDDAKRAKIYDINNLPMDKLVFDHEKIITDYLKR